MDYEKLAKDIENADQDMRIDRTDFVEIKKDSNFPHGYAVTIDWKAGTDGDGVDNPMDLDQLFFEDIDNDTINAVLDNYRYKLATYYLKNGQDERGSELDHAKALIADKNNSLTQISEITKIPYQSLRNYRANISSLDKASWLRINLLSQVYDMFEGTYNMSQDDVPELQKMLHGLFSDMRNYCVDPITPADDCADPTVPDLDNVRMHILINQMEQKITNDPAIIYKIFKTIKNI